MYSPPSSDPFPLPLRPLNSRTRHNFASRQPQPIAWEHPSSTVLSSSLLPPPCNDARWSHGPAVMATQSSLHRSSSLALLSGCLSSSESVSVFTCVGAIAIDAITRQLKMLFCEALCTFVSRPLGAPGELQLCVGVCVCVCLYIYIYIILCCMYQICNSFI